MSSFVAWPTYQQTKWMIYYSKAQHLQELRMITCMIAKMKELTNINNTSDIKSYKKNI